MADNADSVTEDTTIVLCVDCDEPIVLRGRWDMPLRALSGTQWGFGFRCARCSEARNG